ncbi:hypothetical protein GCM10010295_18860 [Streptomyces intermedius]
MPPAASTSCSALPVCIGRHRHWCSEWREIDDADLRRHRLVLTAEGTEARDRALAALAAEYDRRLARITPRDRAELQRMLQEMLSPV